MMPAFPDLGPACGVSQVSIIISNHNYARFLLFAVESALQQRGVPVEVIVVDNGSTDGSRELLAQYEERAQLIFQDDIGQVGAFNSGFEASTGTIVMFLDADDVLHPDIAAAVWEAFVSRPGTGRAMFRLELVDDAGQPLNQVVPPARSQLPDGDVRRAVLTHPDDLAWPPTSGNAFSARVLRQILPLPWSEDQTGADMYLHALTPLFGPVVALDRVGGAYRLHDRNSHLRSGFDIARSRWILGKARVTHAAIDEFALRLGYQRPSPRSATLLAHRLISLRWADAGHPVVGDTRPKILLAAARALGGRSDLSLGRRSLSMTWFALTAIAPRVLLPRLGDAVFGLGLAGRSDA